MSKMEGIIPAIESAHALAYAMKLAPTMDKEKIIVVNGIYNEHDKSSFLSLLSEEHVTDILFVQGAESFSKLAYRQGIAHLVSEKKE